MTETATAPSQGAPAPGVQAGAPAQGGGQNQPTAGSQSDDGQFNWGLFPDVPEAQRELLQPHFQKMQGYTTQLEQRYAPYQSLISSVQPDQVENLIGFLSGYSSDPTATVLGMLQSEFQEGKITAEQLMELTGQQQGAPAPGQQAQPGQEEQIPQWAQQLQQRLEAQDAEKAAEAEAAQEAELQQVMDQAKTNIRAQLTQGNIPENLVTDQMIVAAVIANDGDEQAAANMFSSLRDGFLGAFTQSKTADGTQPTVRGQVPQTPKNNGRKGDGYAAAKQGAKQYLEQQRQMVASG